MPPRRLARSQETDSDGIESTIPARAHELGIQAHRCRQLRLSQAVPQMADSENVLKHMGLSRNVEIIGVVVNERGAERAIATQAVTTLGYPYSISATFLKRNQNQTPDECYKVLQSIKTRADETGLGMVVYVSMAFGNPYGDSWDEGKVSEAIEKIANLSIRSISLADTVGVAAPDLISRVMQSVTSQYASYDIGVHMHSTRNDASTKVLAAYDAGCRRFDSAVGGLGGCPFAQDTLIGNIPTESVIEALEQRDVKLPIRQSLQNVLVMNSEIASNYG